MRASDALGMSDRTLAELYSKWSEDSYCAGWIADGEEEFTDWLLQVHDDAELVSYNADSVQKIRQLLTSIANEEHEQ